MNTDKYQDIKLFISLPRDISKCRDWASAQKRRHGSFVAASTELEVWRLHMTSCMTFDPEAQRVQTTKREDLLWNTNLCMCVCVCVCVCVCWYACLCQGKGMVVMIKTPCLVLCSAVNLQWEHWGSEHQLCLAHEQGTQSWRTWFL
jgi:hypothetical protein